MLNKGLVLGRAMAEIAADHAGDEWKEMAYQEFKNFASRQNIFTTEQVRKSIPFFPAPPDNRAWGHVALRAKREGIVESHGWVRADSLKVHGMVVTLWRTKGLPAATSQAND